MTDKNLESVLNEYEQKRRKAQMDAESKILELYKQYPVLEKIDDELNQYAINKSKSILNGEKNTNKYDFEMSKLKNKKEEFLREKKIDIEKFKPKYECKICNDTGYIQDENGKSVMCHCLKQDLLNLSYNKSNLSDIKNENFDNFNINLF